MGGSLYFSMNGLEFLREVFKKKNWVDPPPFWSAFRNLLIGVSKKKVFFGPKTLF